MRFLIGLILMITAAGPVSLPYARLAELASISPTWQSLNGVVIPSAALPMIRYPSYDILDEGNLVEVPLIVISNPVDLPLTLVKPNGMQANQRHSGSLLLTIFLPEDTSINSGTAAEIAEQRFLKYTNDVGLVLKDMLLAADSEKEDPTDGYYLNMLQIDQAIAPGKCSPHKLLAIVRDSDPPEADTPPVIVYSSAWICHWM